jgi:hypothetical protein
MDPRRLLGCWARLAPNKPEIGNTQEQVNKQHRNNLHENSFHGTLGGFFAKGPKTLAFHFIILCRLTPNSLSVSRSTAVAKDLSFKNEISLL